MMDIVEIIQVYFQNLAGDALSGSGFLQSFVVDGIISGVGSVLVFAPVIFLIFLAMALLEDTGYMARAAFIMDKFMHKIGLHGRSFLPMLLGFACNVPAIMSTRTIEDRSDRITTILINPFMSCGARLPVYALFISAFFSEKLAGNILFALYLTGIIAAAISAKIFRKYLFKGKAQAFVMELPPYRMPTIKGLLIHMWERGVLYLKKAGTVIFAGCIVIWFLSNFPQISNKNLTAMQKMEQSYAGKIGKTIAPIFKPLGFDDWKISVGLVGGLVAKEIVVGTLGTLYSVESQNKEALRDELKNAKRSDGKNLFMPLTALSFMVFVLLYIPCLATIAVIRRETKSWIWPIFAVVYTTSVAYLASFLVYQVGMLFGF